jgi:predicted double-glycine peptidase
MTTINRWMPKQQEQRPFGKAGMTQFRLLRQTRQMTEYSCGASALQSVLSYWGREVDEQALMELIGTNAEVGTFPEDLVRGARSLGFHAEAKEGLTLEDVRQSTTLGHPVIALAQLWRSQKDTPASVAEEWDCGHYIVVLAVDDDYVYFQDPYVRMGKGFVPRKTFEDHWHQIMGGRDLARSGELIHLAIFVRGDEPPRKPTGHDGSPLPDLSRLGSVNVLNVSFAEHLLPFDFLDDLRSWLVDHEEILRADAFVLVRKDAEGRVSAMQGGRLRDTQDALEVNVLIAAMAAESIGGTADQVRSRMQAAIRAASTGDFGFSANDLRRVAERLPASQSEVIIMFENVWERRFRDTVQKHNGTVTDQRLVPAAAIAKLGRDLGWP